MISSASFDIKGVYSKVVNSASFDSRGVG